jgi:hypothetical protein
MNALAAIAAALALTGPLLPDGRALGVFLDHYRPEVQRQVHIEQRVIIRLAPSSASVRREMFDSPPERDQPVRYKEKKLARCVEIDDIAGIAPMQNRLLLFMRDHRLLSVALERVCDPDAFYLGASVERNADGRLCSGRDTLRARTGANCQISRINRLVAIKDEDR